MGAVGDRIADTLSGVVTVPLESEGPPQVLRSSAAAEAPEPSQQPDQPAASRGLSAVALVLLVLLRVVGPDHVGVLAPLAAASGPSRALKVGFAWGAGHCLGMAGVVLLAALGGGHSTGADGFLLRYGEYLIGLSMLCCGAYFLTTEKRYLELLSDSHGLGRPSLSNSGHLRSSLHAEGKEDAARVPASMLPPPAPAEPPLGPAGAALGCLQGACCPSAPIGAALAAQLPGPALACSLAALLLLSAASSGFAALLWARTVSSGAGQNQKVSQKAMYRASCAFACVLGIAWIVATFEGLTVKLEPLAFRVQ